MSEQTIPDSLATRARRLTALSRAKTDNEKQSQDETQLDTALRKLNTELSDLATVIAAHRKLVEIGAPVQPTNDLDKAPKRLRDQVEGIGRPTAQFVTARSKDASTTRVTIAETNNEAWRTWAEHEIANLPIGLIPRLNLAQRQPTIARVAELRKTSVLPQIRSSDITIFTSSLQTVKEILAGVGESNLDLVLAKFDNGRLRLADLSEDELRMLREDSALSEQLYLVLS